MNKNKGITLIALVVTIIVLIILAGISINLLLGDNGILKKAKDSASEQEIGQRKEAVSMAVTAEYANKNGDASLMTVEGVLKELQVTQGSTSIYAKKGETEIRSTDGSTPLEGGETFHFPSGSDKEVVITLDENLNVRVAETQTVDNNNNNNNNNDNNQSQGGNQTGEGQEIDETLYGFFDANGNQLASWSTLIEAPYNMRVENNYGYYEYNVSHDTGNSPAYVMKHASSLSGGAFTTEDIKEVRIPGSVSTTTGNINENTKLASIAISDSQNEIKVAETTSINKIGKYAFYKCNNLTKVVISDTITTIGENAFDECEYLTDVTLGNNVTQIGNRAFHNCYRLVSIIIPDSVTNIGDYTFYYTGISEIEIPSTTKNIGMYSFYNSSLQKITLGNDISKVNESNLRLGEACFRGDKLTQYIIKMNTRIQNQYGNVAFYYDFNYQDTNNIEVNVTIVDGVTTVAAFSGLRTLKNITIPTSVTTIGSNAFSGCSKLESITIPTSVTTIGGSAFKNCASLTSVEIPNTVTSLGSESFYQCRNLTTMKIGNNVPSITYQTFKYCDKLSTLTIGSGVQTIGDEVFIGCNNLENITIDSNNTKYDSRNNCNAIIETATNKLVFGCKNTTVPNNVSIIGDKAFYCSSNLTSINIPSSVTKIENQAFYCCVELTSIEMQGVTSIENQAFEGCRKLESVTLGSNLATIETRAFRECRLLSSIVIPSSVNNIKSSAFENCERLSDVTIENTSCNIASNAFNGCPWPPEPEPATSTSTASNQ